ncbi:hypothetical protein WDJ51_03165 [Rathayibacter sp. YIM 133350]|uniref:SHOCT domain-containing protein n=1 Tax=Rathayibacter sp. YIM 133350 TaxID=3131992 RepID=UPI00307E5565
MISTLTAASLATHWAGPWAGGFGWLFLLIPLFWITVFVLIFTFAGRRWRRFDGGGYGPWSAPSRAAEQVLAERYARGDVDEQEYRARLEVLRASRPDGR